MRGKEIGERAHAFCTSAGQPAVGISLVMLICYREAVYYL